MLVNIRLLPGMRDIPEYRIEITDGPGTRPVVPPNVRTTEGLRNFLTHRLGQPKIVANRVLAQLEAMPHSATVIEDVRLDANSLAQVVREMDKAETARLDALTQGD